MDRKPPFAAGSPARGPKSKSASSGAQFSPRAIARALNSQPRREAQPLGPPKPKTSSGGGGMRFWAIGGAVSLLALGGAGGWWLWTPPGKPTTSEVSPDVARQPAPPSVAAAPPAPVAPQATRGLGEMPHPDLPIITESEQPILQHVEADATHGMTAFRFKANPRILVLDFPSLHQQGRMLNRAAALIEKSGMPHDRLLNDADLDAAIRAGGDTVETFYYGHDYGAPSLVRFFSLADQENIPLTDEEKSLRRLLRQDDWFSPDARGALISIPQVGADEHVTLQARATILHHELSHGEYFTNPAYAAYVQHFWKQTLTEAERQQVRKHLRSLGYDPALDDLMQNEAQAYLMFTDDTEFFRPDMFGMTKGRVGELRSGFYKSMPAGWLRDSLGEALGVNKTAAEHP